MSAAALPRVRLEIEQSGKPLGAIVLELAQAQAPLTVENFLKYVDSGFFDGTIFHRVIATFMIQGGGYSALNQAKRSGLLAPIQNEAKSGLKNKLGTIAMARTGEPHSATSQFFINVADNEFLDHPGQDGWGYCAFGAVVEGMDVVEQLKQTPTRASGAMRGEKSEPLDPPLIRSARRA